jgi:hypothetical protein
VHSKRAFSGLATAVSSRLSWSWFAALFVIVALLVIVGEPGQPPAEASHAGGMDAMSLDMDPTGNEAAVVGSTGEGDEFDANCANGNDDDPVDDPPPGPGGTVNDGCPVLGNIESCARINENNIIDADEDSVADTLSVDVIAQGIPATNRMIAWNTDVTYDSAFLRVSAQNGTSWYLAARPGSSVFDGGDLPPGTDGAHTLTFIDAAPAPGSGHEAGSGVLARIEFESVAPGPGVIALVMPPETNVHIDETQAFFYSDTINNAMVAIDQVCPIVADIDVTAVTLSAPSSGLAGTPFNVTVDADLTNNGPKA